METSDVERRWSSIEQQTSELMEQIELSDAEDLQCLLQRRQEELEAFFHELEYTPTHLEDIESRIINLLERDSTMVDTCLRQQSSLLDQSKQLRESREAAEAYSQESRRII
ncbi:MAG: hypothetical protein AAF542_16735 [Pseudomonadota bacterium]